MFLSHHSSNVFCPLHEKNFDTNEKISCRIDESITSFYNKIYRPLWWVDQSDEFIFFFLDFFSGENSISSRFRLITARFSLDTSGETTSWITLVYRSTECSYIFWLLLLNIFCFSSDFFTYQLDFSLFWS